MLRTDQNGSTHTQISCTKKIYSAIKKRSSIILLLDNILTGRMLCSAGAVVASVSAAAAIAGKESGIWTQWPQAISIVPWFSFSDVFEFEIFQFQKLKQKQQQPQQKKKWKKKPLIWKCLHIVRLHVSAQIIRFIYRLRPYEYVIANG